MQTCVTIYNENLYPFSCCCFLQFEHFLFERQPSKHQQAPRQCYNVTILITLYVWNNNHRRANINKPVIYLICVLHSPNSYNKSYSRSNILSGFLLNIFHPPTPDGAAPFCPKQNTCLALLSDLTDASLTNLKPMKTNCYIDVCFFLIKGPVCRIIVRHKMKLRLAFTIVIIICVIWFIAILQPKYQRWSSKNT